MSGRSCTNCGSSELEQDQARGDVVCTRCGSVLEDNLIVSEVQYEEGTHGASHIVGQMVGDGGFKGLSVGGIIGSGKESRQVTLDNAKRKIKGVGAQLRLNNHCIDMAFNFYKRALQKRLTHGRKHTHVIAACVYITCRIEGTSHMLLDLSDIMQVNVYELGRTYLKLSSSLCLNIPAIDPCLYIYRFAHRLELGEKSHEIEMTAMRIAQRMKRDWMHFGRRPSGLCGAALLVAARLHDTHCAVKDIIKIVKVCEATIRKRLSEFGDTPTSKLTLDEFMSVDLEGEEDPPCFKAARKRMKAQIDPDVISEECVGEISQLQDEIEQELEKSRKRPRGPWAKYSASTPEGSATPSKEVSFDETEITAQFVVAQTVDTLNEIINGPAAAKSESPEMTLRPTASSLGLTETFGLATISSTKLGSDAMDDSGIAESFINPSSGELELDDIDDDEIDGYILNDHEAAIKRKFWEQLNADWIKEMSEKAQRKAEEEAERKEKEAQGELPVKKKRKTKKRTPIQANSAGEAIEKMLQEKRISNKINYDVLKQLSKPSVPQVSTASLITDIIVTPSVLPAMYETTPIRRLPSIRSSLVNLPNTKLFKRSPVKGTISDRRSSVNVNETIVAKEQLKVEEKATLAAPAVDDDVDDFLEDDDEEDEDAVPKEEIQLSITQLMSHNIADEPEFEDYEAEDDF